MDIIAHGLWSGLGVRWVKRRRPVPVTTAGLAVGVSILPDIVHLLPVTIWAIFGLGTIDQLFAYATAVPGSEPAMPSWVGLWSHHLHCTMHSAIIATAFTLALRRWWATIWLPLAGWWLHILIDVFTHSAEFYPVSVLYPITYRGFDGIAWNTPWFVVVNYSALLLCWVAGRNRTPKEKPQA